MLGAYLLRDLYVISSKVASTSLLAGATARLSWVWVIPGVLQLGVVVAALPQARTAHCACSFNSSAKCQQQPVLQTLPARNQQLAFRQLAACTLQNCKLGISTLSEELAWRYKAEKTHSPEPALAWCAAELAWDAVSEHLPLAQVNPGERSSSCSTSVFISSAA